MHICCQNALYYDGTVQNPPSLTLRINQLDWIGTYTSVASLELKIDGCNLCPITVIRHNLHKIAQNWRVQLAFLKNRRVHLHPLHPSKDASVFNMQNIFSQSCIQLVKSKSFIHICYTLPISVSKRWLWNKATTIIWRGVGGDGWQFVIGARSIFRSAQSGTSRDLQCYQII